MTAPRRRIAAGDTASVTRSISEADVAGYVALGGAPPEPGQAPEPLIAALFSYLLGVELPGQGANYLKQETVYHRAAPVGAPLIATVTVTKVRARKALIDLATTCHGADATLYVDGRSLVLASDVDADLVDG